MIGQIKVLKKGKDEAKQNAMKYLERVGMAPYINAKPRQLSGGPEAEGSHRQSPGHGAGSAAV